jgi:hypothetical protein
MQKAASMELQQYRSHLFITYYPALLLRSKLRKHQMKYSSHSWQI